MQSSEVVYSFFIVNARLTELDKCGHTGHTFSMNIAIREAKNNFSRYGNLAHAGNRVTVCKNGKPWFDLVPHKITPRSVKPLAKPTVSAAKATAPVDPRDIQGWL